VDSSAQESQLFGVKANDPVTFGGTVALLICAAAAAFIPAWRASRIDPSAP
jgi:ABC-type lipoprotein release transport system permease subunit